MTHVASLFPILAHIGGIIRDCNSPNIGRSFDRTEFPRCIGVLLDERLIVGGALVASV